MGDPLDGYATQVAPPTPPPAPNLNDLGALQVAPPTITPAQVAKPAVKTATTAAAAPQQQIDPASGMPIQNDDETPANTGGAGGSWDESLGEKISNKAHQVFTNPALTEASPELQIPVDAAKAVSKYLKSLGHTDAAKAVDAYTGAQEAVGDFEKSMSSPENLASMFALGRLQSMGRAGMAVERLVSAGFSADMLSKAYQNIPEVKAAVASGDWEKAARALAGEAGSLVMGGMAAHGAVEGGAGVKEEAKTEAPAQIEPNPNDDELREAGAVQITPPTKSVVDTTIAPHNFLNTIGANDGGAMSSEQVELYRDMIRKGSDIQPPVIEYDENGNIVGGDGRHRAMAYALENTERMPVRVHRQLVPEVAEEPRYDLGELQPLRATQSRTEEGGLHPDVPEKAAAAVREGNGFTLHPTTGETPTTGFAVEAHTEGQTRLDHPATPQDIKDFYEKNKEQFDAHPELHIGGYGNELGVSAVVPEEGRARSLAERLDQKSIWDFENQREIPTGGTGETTQFPHYPLEQRMKDVTGSESSNADNPESQQATTPLQKIADKYGVSEDPSKIKDGASFITPEGQFIHLPPGVQHETAIDEATANNEQEAKAIRRSSKDTRPEFINNSGAIRVRFYNEKQGPTVHISVPSDGVTQDQIPAVQQAIAQAGRYGNVVMERADITPETKDRLSMSQEFPRAGDTENYLRRIEAHPDQHEGTEETNRVPQAINIKDYFPERNADGKILPGGKPLEIPQEVLPEGPHTTESTLHHEAAHAVIGSLNGIDGYQMLSHLHPESEEGGFSAAMDFDFRNWGGDSEGHIAMGDVTKHVPEMLNVLAAGGVSDEVYHGMPWDENNGINGDQAFMARILDAAEVPQEKWQDLIDAARDNVKKVLTSPGVRETIEKHMGTRAEGLDEALHMDDVGLKAMTDEVKGKLNGDTQQSGRVDGSDNQENDARTEGQGEGESVQEVGKEVKLPDSRENAIDTDIPLTKLSVSPNAYSGASSDIYRGRKSRTEGPISVIRNPDNGQYLVEDGIHRLVEAHQRGDETIPAKLWEGYSDTASVHGEKMDMSPLEKEEDEPLRAEQKRKVKAAPEEEEKAPLEVAPGETISTRVPTAKKAVEDSMTHGLVIDSKAIYDNPELAKKMANEVRNYPGLKVPEGASDTQVLDAFKEHLKDNIKYVYDQTTPEEREAHGGWYEGANKFAADRAAEHDLTTAQGAGVLASMSPQKDWDMNASLAKRTMDIWDNKQSTKTTPEMMARGKQLASAKNSKGEYTNEAVRKLLPKIEGKKLKDLNPDLQALWIRIYDEAHNPREFNKINPDGSEGPIRTTMDGDPERVAWGSLSEIGKSVKILKDGSRDNISKSLGFSHKIRNFFNNIIEPNSPRQDLTADTHAVAAAQLRPLSGNSPEVKKNFGGIMHAMSGTKGTYALYADAYREAAKDLDIPMARSLQSIVWEKIRSEFPADIKSKENLGGIDSIWKEYTDGQISKREAQDAIFEAARGYRDQAFGGGGGASDQGKLFEPGVSGESAPGNGGGRGGNSTSGSLGKRGGVSKGAIDALSFINMMKSQKGASRTGAALMGAGIAGAGAIAALSGNKNEETAPAPQPTASQSLYTIGNPDGLKEPGNLELNSRPIVQNADGTHSSEYSISFGTDKGEVLVPTVVNGRFLTPDGKKPPEGSRAEQDMFEKAKQHYRDTGENLGIFDTPEHADTYANQVHNRYQPKARTVSTDVHGLIKKASNDYGVPEAILHAQADQESKFNQDAVSSKGARGVMQLMPNTARSLNVDPNDMAQNVDGGARLMSQLHHRFGSYDKALAAYNWSPDKVQDAIDTYGNDWLKHTPAETRNYVLRIMKNSR